MFMCELMLSCAHLIFADKCCTTYSEVSRYSCTYCKVGYALFQLVDCIWKTPLDGNLWL